MHSAAVEGASAGADAKSSNGVQTNSNIWTVMFNLPDGQTLPVFSRHRVRSPVLSILSGLLPRGGESTQLELPKFSNSPDEAQSILLAWNELVSEQIMLEAQNMDMKMLLRLLMVRVHLL